jgi:hypothetical protein
MIAGVFYRSGLSLAIAAFYVTATVIYAESPSAAQTSVGAPSIQVVINQSLPPLSTFQGLGVEFDPYENPPSPERWQTILRRVEFAHFGFFRVMSSASDYCLGFDNTGAPIYVWNHPDAKTQQRLDRLLAMLDFAQAHGISVYLGEWSPVPQLGIKTPDDARWQRIIADFVQYLVRQRHYSVIDHYIFFNEPNGRWMWPASGPDYQAWSRGIRQLRQEMDARSLTSVQLAGPDNSGDNNWFVRSVHDLAAQFGAWESHIYATDGEVTEGVLETELNQARTTILTSDPSGASKTRFLAESGMNTGKDSKLDQQQRVKTFPYGVLMADYATQVARAGWMGADAWDLDDRQHFNRLGTLKIWGFWDSSPESDMQIRPWFYPWSLISRFFPKGSSILSVDLAPSDKHFRATAAEWSSAKGKHASILLVNEEDAAKTVAIHAPAEWPKKFYCYHYFDKDRPADKEGLPIPAGILKATKPEKELSVSMPARGVVLLTTEEP